MIKEEKKSYVSYAVECLKDLYRKTDKEGYFYIQGCDYYESGDEEEYECVTSFTKKEFRDSMFGISMDMSDIEAIAEMKRNKEFTEEALQDEPKLKETYERLLKPFEHNLPSDLLERLNLLDEEEMSEEETEIYKSYCAIRSSDSAKRVGDGLNPHYYVIRAQRVAKLLELGTPDIIVNNEVRCFVIAYVLFHYGKSVTNFEESDYIDDLVHEINNRSSFKSQMSFKELTSMKTYCSVEYKSRHEIDMMTQEEKDAYLDTLNDDEINEIYEREHNQLKSLAPLFIYFILKDHKGQKMSQKEIREELFSRYEVKLSERALSRIIHTLTQDEFDYGLRYYQNVGAYYVGEGSSED